MRCRDLCQTHYKQQRLTGSTKPIQRKRAPRTEAVIRFAGFGLTPLTAQTLDRAADVRQLTRNALITDILEEWAKRYRAEEADKRRRPS